MIIEFSILQFSKIQSSPMLTYGPNFTAFPILQFLPMITGPIIEESCEISALLPTMILPLVEISFSIRN